MTSPTAGNSTTDNLPKGFRACTVTSAQTREASRFFVGGNHGKDRNSIFRVYDYIESRGQLEVARSYQFEDLFVRLTACPSAESVVLAANRNGSTDTVSFLEMNEPCLSRKQKLDGSFDHLNALSCISNEHCVVSDLNGVYLYSEAGTKIASTQITGCSGLRIMDGNKLSIIASGKNTLHVIDLRSAESSTLRFKHLSSIRAIDVNPNRSHIVVIGCEDGKIVFCDIRRTAAGTNPIQIFDAHNHHVTDIMFNPLHDELVLSSGTDCSLNLWRCESSSSRSVDRPPSLIENKRAPLSPVVNPSSTPADSSFLDKHARILTLNNDDRLVSRIDRHNDTINSVCWSHASPWVFASVSNDGLVMINSVPKYIPS